MQNNTIEQLQPGADDRGADDLTDGPEREVVFAARDMNSLVLWFSSFQHRELRNEDVSQLLDLPVPTIAIMRNHKSGVQVLRSAKGASPGTLSYNSACDSQVASKYGLPVYWYVSGTICQNYAGHVDLDLGDSGFHYLETKVMHLFEVGEPGRGFRPRTTATMHLVNALNNGWLSRETLAMCGLPAHLEYHRLYRTDPVVRALENATKRVGMLTYGMTLLETAQHVLTHGRNFADNLNETLSKVRAQEAWA